MAKKPPSAFKGRTVKKIRTARDWVIIGIYIVLALALVIPLVSSLFSSSASSIGF
jgi:hypothetical protein